MPIAPIASNRSASCTQPHNTRRLALLAYAPCFSSHSASASSFLRFSESGAAPSPAPADSLLSSFLKPTRATISTIASTYQFTSSHSEYRIEFA
eukprot:31500-Pelagococcus_subviridis.AAC.2